MNLRLESQANEVADEVSAVTAVVRPILTGVLFALKKDIVDEVGGYENVKVKMLTRLYQPGDGDCGICFEYAVHDAMRRNDPMVSERVADVLTKHCRIPGGELGSILFAVEKQGVNKLIDTATESLTSQSKLMYGTRGHPVYLRRHLGDVAEAFRKRKNPPRLPQSISGLWKADLFLGKTDTDRWVGTTVKINARQLEPARGLRVGVVPARHGASDLPFRDEQKNLIVCPLKHDGDFMEIFYSGWQVVQQFIHADARVPREVSLPQAPLRQVARYLADRREFPVLEVVESLAQLAQPQLLHTTERPASTVVTTKKDTAEVQTMVAPMPLTQA
ncbi:hypothetical protein H1Q78_14375 [Cellulosimicrobium cellulans]|nr:hypothetical protein H1Q78_14375 [Cellulosimicrobium cellulans]